METSWSIVEFVESKTVEAVPTKWLQNNECFWPPLPKSKIINEIRKHSSPNTHWPMFTIRRFKDGTFTDYNTARRKAIKAEETSDLNSDSAMARRKIKKKIFDSDSSKSDIDEFLLEPVAIKVSSKSTSRVEQSQKGKTTELGHKSTINEISNAIEENNSMGHRYPIAISQSVEQTPEGLSSTAHHCTCRDLHKKLDHFMSDMTKKMSSLKANYYQLREDIQIIISKLETHQTRNDEIAENFLKLFQFPIKDEATLINANNYLQDEVKFKQAVQQMSKLGGRDTYDFIRRCFQETIDDKLAVTYTYDGTKQKKSFKELKICDLFLAASNNVNEDTHKSTEIAIRKWLRRAHERLVYKKK